MQEKANILVLGTSGAGKSTLINTIIGSEVAQVGSGGHVTEKMESYDSEELNFRLIDSRGFEYSLWNTNKGVKDMKEWMRKGLKDEKPRIHMLWFCVDATSHRFTKQTIKTMEKVKKLWPEVPIIVVLTKSFFESEDENNIEMVKNTFQKFGKNADMPISIVPVLAVPPMGAEVLPRGITELINITEENIDKAVQASDIAVENFGLQMKWRKAQMVVAAATASATVVGAVPVSFPDAAILTPLEAKMIDKIAEIYEQDSRDERHERISLRIIEAGAATLVAKTIINQLKLIPGVINLAADVLNAIVAGSIVFGIGQAAAVIMKKAYLGEIEEGELSWIDDIVGEMSGKTVNKIVDYLSTSGGKIKVSELVKILFS